MGCAGEPSAADLAWRAFGRVIDVTVELPIVPIDGDLSYTDLHSGEAFRFQEAEGKRFLRLTEFGSWVGRTTLSSRYCYISFSLARDAQFVTFHGWHRPTIESVPLGEDDLLAEAVLPGRELLAMPLLIEPMRRRLRQPPHRREWEE